MNKKGLTEKDILKWITIAAIIILGYIIYKAVTS